MSQYFDGSSDDLSILELAPRVERDDEFYRDIVDLPAADLNIEFPQWFSHDQLPFNLVKQSQSGYRLQIITDKSNRAIYAILLNTRGEPTYLKFEYNKDGSTIEVKRRDEIEITDYDTYLALQDLGITDTETLMRIIQPLNPNLEDFLIRCCFLPEANELGIIAVICKYAKDYYSIPRLARRQVARRVKHAINGQITPDELISYLKTILAEIFSEITSPTTS